MATLFLPFTPKGKATELIAIEVKSELGLGPAACVDPYAILPQVPARLVDDHELWEQSPAMAQVLFVDQANHWSGIGYGKSSNDGYSLILLNPSHSLTRRRATLMEEIVHIVRAHPKTAILDGGNGATRSYDSHVEDEAYAVGAACILPYPEIFRAISDNHETVEMLAHRFGVSTQYVEYRIKRAGLSAVYRKRCGLS